MKNKSQILILSFCFTLSGCMTSATIERARGYPYQDSDGKMVPTEKTAPFYYLLLPFAFPGDVALSPFEAFWDLAKTAN